MSSFAPQPDDPSRADSGADDAIGPDLRELFDQTRPAEPSESDWGRVRTAVAEELPRPGLRWRTAGWAAAAAILVAVGAVALWPGGRNPGPVREDPADSAAEFAVLPVAQDDDVEIHSVRRGAWRAAVVGRDQILSGFAWARPGDVRITSSTPDEYFGFEPKMSPDAQAMPVIVADDSLNDKDK